MSVTRSLTLADIDGYEKYALQDKSLISHAQFTYCQQKFQLSPLKLGAVEPKGEKKAK